MTALALATPELECISLHGTDLSDGAIRALCEACPKLRHINVSMTHMTERSLRLLAEKDSLRCAVCFLGLGLGVYVFVCVGHSLGSTTSCRVLSAGRGRTRRVHHFVHAHCGEHSLCSSKNVWKVKVYFFRYVSFFHPSPPPFSFPLRKNSRS